MSDASTPRTDEFQARIASSGSTHGAYELCLDHARQLEHFLAAKTAELEEAKKWHVSNWTCVHHSDKEREDNKPCCPVCARRELADLRHTISTLTKEPR